jgi:hypothetical protein
MARRQSSEPAQIVDGGFDYASSSLGIRSPAQDDDARELHAASNEEGTRVTRCRRPVGLGANDKHNGKLLWTISIKYYYRWLNEHS